ncbi:MAG: NAD(P)-dependent oxidoreductase [Trueperaceae bacterium]|nr:NAD(P)-dependent oxidoreductase [Trueperaceae bacterium]
MKRILVTGGAGYIGSVLTRQLLEKGYKVRVLDNLRFGGEALLDVLKHPHFEFVKGDVLETDSLKTSLKDVWAIVHLAAIVGDPACAREPELARETNLEASKRLYQLAEQTGVERFVFASTCSNYGKMKNPNSYVNETSELSPVSIYAETKVAFEKFLLSQARTNHCKATSLRFSTVYGLSPRIRFDLTVNEFTKELALGRELVVFGEQFWRPYCHVVDLARSAVLMLESDAEKVAFDVFNVGDTSENYQKQTIIELIQHVIPEAKIKFVQKNEDPRDYRVSFEKIKTQLNFELTQTVPDGIREIAELVQQGFILNPDDQKYYNIPKT